MFQAAASGDTNIIAVFVEQGKEINMRDSNQVRSCCFVLLKLAQDTALHHAATGGHEDVVKQLVTAGASVNVYNVRYWDIVKRRRLMIGSEFKGDSSVVCTDERTCFHYRCSQSFWRKRGMLTVVYVSDCHLKPGASEVLKAAKHGDMQVVTDYINSGGDLTVSEAKHKVRGMRGDINIFVP